MPQPPDIATEALIIGAGPAGLYQAFQLALQGIACHIVDVLPHAGGQCAQLYPDKPIYDIPAIRACSGRELVRFLCAQIAPLDTPLHLGQHVTHMQALEDGCWQLHTAAGLCFHARSVFIAAGVGAFVPKALKVPGVEQSSAAALHYHPQTFTALRGQHVLVCGGEQAAVEAVLQVAQVARSTWLLHRRDAFQADAPQLAQLQALRAAGKIRVLTGQISAVQAESGKLQSIRWLDSAGRENVLPVQQLVVCHGISPHIGPLAQWPLAMERKHLCVNPATLAASQSGVYAIGDIAHYPGKRKLIACAFHEATLAAFAAFEYLRGEKAVLQYTTTSARVHAILGVA